MVPLTGHDISRNTIRFGRLMWIPPRRIHRPWTPRLYRTTDPHYGPVTVVVTPGAGSITLFGPALRSGGHVTWHSIRVGRLMYWPPWTVSRPCRPHVELTGDENCNPSILAVLPFLGAVIVFYGRRWRTETDGPCDRCVAEQAAEGYQRDGNGTWTRVSAEDLAAVPVATVTTAEFEAVKQRMLNELGVTFDELAAQARAGDFVSEHARRVWFAIKPLAG